MQRRSGHDWLRAFRAGCLDNLGFKVFSLLLALLLYAFVHRPAGGEAPLEPQPSECPRP
jgi:hypothetical protein